MLIQQISEIIYQTRIRKSATDLELKELIEKPTVLIDNYLVKTLSNLIKHILNQQRKHHIIDALKIILFSPELAIQALQFTLQVEVSTKSKNHNKEMRFSLSYTGLALKFGETLTECFLLQHPLLQKVIVFYGNTKDKLRQLTNSENNQFMQYLRALKEDDTVQLDMFYSKFKVHQKVSTENTALANLIKYYILTLILTEADYGNILCRDLTFIIEELKNKEDLYTCKHELNEIFVNIGALLINECTKQLVHKMPPLFEETIIQPSSTKKKKVIQLNPDLVSVLMEQHSINKPFLMEYNQNYVAEAKDSMGLFNSIEKHKRTFIHRNNGLNLQLTENCYLHETKPKLYLTVDFIYYKFFICYYHDLMSTGTLEDKKATCIYLYELNDTDFDTSNEKLIEELIAYGLDFNNEQPNLSVIIEEALKNKENYKLYNMYNKMCNQRFMIKGLLKDALIYIPFEGFIQDTFLCSRGRIYNNTDFMNIQSFPLAKAFIKPYNFGTITQQNYESFKNSIINQLKYPVTKKEVNNINYHIYKTQQALDLMDYIKSYLINPALVNNKTQYDQIFTMDPTNFAMSIPLLLKYIKKKNRVCYVQSLLMYIQYPENLVNFNTYFGYDATASGIQMSAIILRSHSLAKCSNLLIGSEYIDIYQIFSKLCGQTCYDLLHLAKSIHQHIQELPYLFDLIDDNFNDIPARYEQWETHKDNLPALFKTFILMDLDQSSFATEITRSVSNLLQKNNKDLDIWFNDTIKSFNPSCSFAEYRITNFDWLLSAKEKEYVRNHNRFFPSMKKQDVQYLFIIRNIVRTTHCLMKHSLILNEEFFSLRSLFKEAVMTFFYNATSFGRKDSFIALLFKFLPDLNKRNESHYKDVSFIASYLDKFFSYSVMVIMKDGNLLFKISDILSARKKPLIVKNSLFTIIHNPKKQESIVKQTSNFNGKRGVQLTLRRTLNEFDSEAFDRSFIPNFIHGADAWIAHTVVLFHIDLNNILKKKSNIAFRASCQLNHDNFMSNLGPFLKPVLKDCYLQLYHADPITWLLKQLDPEEQQKIYELLKENNLVLHDINNFFVKL